MKFAHTFAEELKDQGLYRMSEGKMRHLAFGMG